MKTETYLGDGLYASYDGYQICLKANSHSNPTDTVYLDPSVREALNNWIEKGYKDYNTGLSFQSIVGKEKVKSANK